MGIPASFVLVPKASMHKDCPFLCREYDVWHPGKVPTMKPVATAHRGQQGPHNQLWFRILGADATHPLASLFWREGIHAIPHPAMNLPRTPSGGQQENAQYLVQFCSLGTIEPGQDAAVAAEEHDRNLCWYRRSGQWSGVYRGSTTPWPRRTLASRLRPQGGPCKMWGGTDSYWEATSGQQGGMKSRSGIHPNRARGWQAAERSKQA